MRIRSLHLMSALLASASALLIASCGSSDKTHTDTSATETSAPATTSPVTVLAENATITPTQGKGIVIDFNATWCGPCRQFHPIFEEVAARYTSLADFYSVDVDIHAALAAQYDVTSIPTVVYIAPDGTVNRTVGFLTASDFSSAVTTYLPAN